MTTRLSWKPINFDRWTNLAFMMTELGVASTSSPAPAILGMRVSWERMAESLKQLFVPSGPPGTHSAHHFHAPSDPSVRERVLASVVTDYESALVYMDVALDLCVKNLSTVADQPYKDWRGLVKAAERDASGLATNARDTILYLQRTPLYVRNDAIVHPRAMLPVTGFDNVGNLLLRRVSLATPSDAQVLQLNDLLHKTLPRIRDDAKVGISIIPAMALNWLGTVSFKVDDWRLLNELRQAFGFLLPGAYEIAPQVDNMVNHFIKVLPDTEFARVVFAAGPTSISKPSNEEHVVAPREADRKSFEALLEEGIMAAKSGQREQALTLFRQCLDVDPEDAEARYLVGQELIGADQLEEGLRFIYEAQAIGYDENLIRRKLILGHFNLGAHHFRAREYDQAVHHYRRVRELDPTDLEAHRCLMEALAYAGRLNEAFRHAALILRDWPAIAEVQLSVAFVYLRADDSKVALNHVQEALKLRPDWEKAIQFQNRVRSQTVPSDTSGKA